MMFLLTCDKKLTKSQLSPTHASTKRKITDELKHNAGWYEVREGSPVEVQWAVRMFKQLFSYVTSLITICRGVTLARDMKCRQTYIHFIQCIEDFASREVCLVTVIVNIAGDFGYAYLRGGGIPVACNIQVDVVFSIVCTFLVFLYILGYPSCFFMLSHWCD